MSGFDSIPAFSSGRAAAQPDPTSVVEQQQLPRADTAAGVNWLDWDVFAAPFRGAEGFLQGIYQFADAITGDSLPDVWDEKFLGSSKSLVGGFTEGMVHFLAGFIPVVGVVSKGSQYGRIAGAYARVGRQLRIPGAKAALARTKVARGEKVSWVSRLGVDTVSGAAVDFALFDGHEKRLSNLFKSHPDLQNPVTDFLAAEDDDNEFVGRIKNVLEGALLGVVADTFIHALSRLKKGRKGKLDGKDAETVNLEDLDADDGRIEGDLRKEKEEGERRAAAEMDPEARPDKYVFTKADADFQVSSGAEKKLKKIVDEVSKQRVRVAKAETTLAKAKAEVKLAKLEAQRDAIVDLDRQQSEFVEGIPKVKSKDIKKVKGEQFYEGVIDGETVRIRRDAERQRWIDMDTGEDVTFHKDDSREIAARNIRTNRATRKNAQELSGEGPLNPSLRPETLPKKLQKVVAHIQQARKNMASGDQQAINKRDLTPEELVDRGLKANGINLALVDEDLSALINAREQLYDAARGTDVDPVSEGKQFARALSSLRDLTGSLDEDALPVGLLTDAQRPKAGNKMAAQADVDLAAARKNANRTYAWRDTLQDVARGLMDAGAKVRKATPEELPRRLAELDAMHSRFAEAHRAVDGLKSIAGRNLRSLKTRASGFERYMATLAETGRQEDLVRLSKLLEDADGDEVKALRFARAAERSITRTQMVVEYWINSILSGGTTISVNFISGVAMAFWRPFERAMGALALGQPGMREMGEDFMNYTDHFVDSLKAFKVAFRENEPQLFASGKLEAFQHGKAVTAANINRLKGRFNLPEKSTAAMMVDVLGTSMRLPSAVLTGTDEMAKVLQFHAAAKNILRRTAMNQGMNPVEAGGFAEKKLADLTYNGQVINEEVLYNKYLDEEMAKDELLTVKRDEVDLKDAAADRASAHWNDQEPDSIMERLVIDEATRAAEESTFTRRIDPEGSLFESVTASVQKIVAKHPTMRFFATFIRTPANILLWARDRTLDPSIALFKMAFSTDLKAARNLDQAGRREWLQTNEVKNRFLRDMMGDVDLKGLDESHPAAKAILDKKREEALGRIATGLGMAGTFMAFAESGMFTGRGPTDRKQREALQQTGWQPYSFKFGDAYYSYRRLDPFATVLGTLADAHTWGKYAPPEDQGVFEQFMVGLVTAMANNATNKTYMTGIKNLVEVLGDPERKMGPWVESMVASFVPAGPSQVGQALAGDDPLMRESFDFLDKAMSKIPYFGDTLDPVRNMLGEPVRKQTNLFGDIDGPIGDVFNLTVPIAYSQVSDDLVKQELGGLDHSFSNPSVTAAGIDMRSFRNDKGQSSYDRMMQLRGEVSIRGVTLKKALRRLIRSRGYQSLDPLDTAELRSPRVDAINNILSRYHRVATRKMRGEFPELSAEILRVRREQQNRRFTGNAALEVVR